MSAVISFKPDGTARCLYTETFPLAALGPLEIKRASSIEFNDAEQLWEVRLGDDPKAPVAFSHTSRAECIRWEIETLTPTL